MMPDIEPWQQDALRFQGGRLFLSVQRQHSQVRALAEVAVPFWSATVPIRLTDEGRRFLFGAPACRRRSPLLARHRRRRA